MIAPLSGWQNFYVIIGSSAGALVGLQFVVLSLVSSPSVTPPDAAAVHAFGSPTVLHFSAVLAVAAIFCAPWDSITGPALLSALVGLCGVLYTFLVIHRIRKLTAYRPQFEDWIFFATLPFIANATLASSAYATLSAPREALFGIAGATLLLLFIGIHNAWDSVTYHIFTRHRAAQREKSKSAG